MNEFVRLLPVTHRRIIGYQPDGTPLEEITAPGLIDVRAYPHLAPMTVPAPTEGKAP